ncbi:hypothetical protein ZHAS_00014354 [Anopheles sinensis]|uniref:Uncharacterized protein n=1 Tax=Anopheles sinensis TaxID=74873 RepID=A0A084W819_ANOSI|nr:hypothetical protein ZHAS_00014354 [Anopheles sinensis]
MDAARFLSAREEDGCKIRRSRFRSRAPSEDEARLSPAYSEGERSEARAIDRALPLSFHPSRRMEALGSAGKNNDECIMQHGGPSGIGKACNYASDASAQTIAIFCSARPGGVGR